MTVARRGLLAGGTAGVGLVVAGAVPSLAQAASGHVACPSPPTAPSRRSWTTRTASGVASWVPVRGGDPRRPDPAQRRPRPHAVQPRRHRGLQGSPQPSAPDPEPRLSAGTALGVPHVEGTVYDQGAVGAGGCTVIETTMRAPTTASGSASPARSPTAPAGPPRGHLADLRETETKKGGARHMDHGYVFEVFADGTSRPKPIRRSAATPTRRWPSTGPAPRTTCRKTPAAPTACSTGGPHPRRKLRAVSPTARRQRRHPRRDGDPHGRRPVLTDVAYITSAQLGRRSRCAG